MDSRVISQVFSIGELSKAPEIVIFRLHLQPFSIEISKTSLKSDWGKAIPMDAVSLLADSDSSSFTKDEQEKVRIASRKIKMAGVFLGAQPGTAVGACSGLATAGLRQEPEEAER